MGINTATRFRWGEYTKTWTLRVLGVSVVCSFLIIGLATVGWVGLLIGGVISTVLIGAVFLWTVAEMIEDGLSDNQRDLPRSSY